MGFRKENKERIRPRVISVTNVPGMWYRCKEETANDPSVAATIKRLQSIQATCREGLAKYETSSGLKSFCAAPPATK